MASILGIPNFKRQGIPKSIGVRLAYMKTWNERLTYARLARKRNKTELANGVGVSNATVSDWESGEIKKLEGENLLKICDFLNISPTWLQFGRGEMDNPYLTEDDLIAININRKLNAKEKKAWYRAGNSLSEPDEGTNGG